MRLFILSAILFLPCLAFQSSAQSAEDTLAIRNTALDYIEGWYSGDEERMERAIHPKLAKRIVAPVPDGNASYLVITSALELVQQTQQGGGTTVPPEERKTEVKILDIYSNAASVRVDAGGWVDYMHIARWNDQWKIINVLWERPND